MLVKVFVIGRPGSGKTTVVRHILKIAKNMSISTVNMKDYDILYKMFQQDVEHEKFESTEYDGFNVLDFSVCDIALEQLEEEARALEGENESGMKFGFITIEFARNDYKTAFNKFSRDFLKDSYFFFIESNLDTCIQRIHKRVTYPPKPDCHYISDYIMDTYYDKDNFEYMQHEFRAEYPTVSDIEVYLNEGSEDELFACVNKFMEGIFSKEFPTTATSFSDDSNT